MQALEEEALSLKMQAERDKLEIESLDHVRVEQLHTLQVHVCAYTASSCHRRVSSLFLLSLFV